MVDFSGDVDNCYQEQLHYYQLRGGEEEPLNTWGRGGRGKGGRKEGKGEGEEKGRGERKESEEQIKKGTEGRN